MNGDLPNEHVRASQGYDERLALAVCGRYFLEGRSKQEIAGELGISRFRVARLIAGARETGLVRIELRPTGDLDHQLADQLAAHLGLRDARVVRADVAPALPEGVTASVGRAAARLLVDRLSPGGLLGIGWGTTVHAVLVGLEAESRPRPVDVVQLRGGVQSAELAFNAIELARRAAELFGGHFAPLYAPALLETVDARRALLREPAIARTVARFPEVTVALTGIGALRPEPTQSYLRSGSLGPEAVSELERAGSVGDAFGQYLDAGGAAIPQFAARTIAPTLSQLECVPLRIAVAAGAAKTETIAAAVRGGWINALVTDAAAAHALLRLPSLARPTEPSPAASA